MPSGITMETTPLLANEREIVPQTVYWAPNAGLPAGVLVRQNEGTTYQLLAWDEFGPQAEQLLLPQLFADPHGYTIGLLDYYEKKDWLCRIFDAEGKPFCALWFGGNPDEYWHEDGLVRTGLADEHPSVWTIHQRYSDGSFRRVGGNVGTLDEAKRLIERKHL
jgi:hypothetical protein